MLLAACCLVHVGLKALLVSCNLYIECIQFRGSSHLLWRSRCTTKWKVGQTSNAISHERREIKQFHTYFCLKSFVLPIDAFKSTRASTIRELCVNFFVFECYQLLPPRKRTNGRRTTFSILLWQKKYSKELD